MRHITPLLLLGGAAGTFASARSAVPRGVGPEFAKHYLVSKETFSCITAPHIVIPISSLNNDYCDCPDGSDEPGTSACSHLSALSPPQPLPDSPAGTNIGTATALPGFYCANKGHKPSYVPFQYINDGVCDYEFCCDGSDEWAHVGGVKCEDRCTAMGKGWKKKEEARLHGEREALRKKKELVQIAQRQRLSVEESIRDLETQIGALTVKEKEAKEKLDETERREKYKVISGGSERATRTTVLAKLAKARIEELRSALAKEVEKKNIAKHKLASLEAILRAFKEEYNPNFNDEGVKRAIKEWEDYVAIITPDAEDEGYLADLKNIQKPDSEDNSGINWEEWEREEEESDVEALYRFEEYLPESLRTWLHGKITDVRHHLIENGILADPSSSSSGESKAIVAARNEWTKAKADIDNVNRNIEAKQSDLSKFYGPDDVFRALKDQCISIKSGEYEYELCWMSKTAQKSLKNGGSTSLGSYHTLEQIDVDEDEGTDGRGLGKGKRWAMKFENGQQCWNGPKRSTVVIMKCTEKEEVWRVVEAEKCVYRMEVGTPAVCEEGVEVKSEGRVVAAKDEL